MRKAYLHIGVPKTGTTAIQKAMAAHRETLLRHGLIYPGTHFHHTHLLAAFHRSGPRHWFFDRSGLSPDAASRLAQDLLDEIRSRAGETDADFLLSSEYLHSLRREGIKALDEFFSSIGYELHIVCYVRHPVSLATSSAQQRLKMGQALLSEVEENPRWHSLEKSLSPALAILGRERLIVRRFEDAKKTGTERDILAAIGYAGPVHEIERTAANSSISMTAAILADAHNRLAREEPHLRSRRGYLLRVGGPPFSLPRSAVERVNKEARRELDWLEATFGITLEEPPLRPVESRSLTVEAARDIVSLILEGDGSWMKKLVSGAGLSGGSRS